MMNTLREIADLLHKHRQFVIAGHINPDGDCMGSMLALGTALKSLGKRVRIIVEGPLPDSLRVLKDEWDYIYAPDFRFAPEDEILLALDSGDLGRISHVPEHNLPIVNIDHHLSNAMYGDYNHVNEKAAAAGEIIYHLIKELGVEFDSKIAYYLSVALMTDTGCFKYTNTHADILRIVANFMEMGVNTSRIYKDFMGTHSLGKIRLKGLVYSKMQTAFEGKVAYVIIDRKMLEEAEATEDDAGSISGELRDIRGVEVGFTIMETESGLVQLGFRSNDIVPVNEVAIHFGGGGHLRASGAQLEGDAQKIVEKVLTKIAEYL